MTCEKRKFSQKSWYDYRSRATLRFSRNTFSEIAAQRAGVHTSFRRELLRGGKAGPISFSVVGPAPNFSLERDSLMEGTVGWYSPDRLFGFITRDGASPDEEKIFFRAQPLQKFGRRALSLFGARISFVLTTDHAGRKVARDVKILSLANAKETASHGATKEKHLRQENLTATVLPSSPPAPAPYEQIARLLGTAYSEDW